MYYILVMTTAGAALDKCHNGGMNEGFEARRQFVMEWELKLRTRYVGLIMNVLRYRFRDDIPTELAAFERTVHDYENQSTKTVDDDIKISVKMLGMEDMRVKESKSTSSGTTSGSPTGIRCEKRFSRSREQNSTSTVNQCQCSSKRIRRARAKAKIARAKAKARMQRTIRPTSKRHSNGRTVAVLTPRRETHVNAHHSHALCIQRNVMRVFQ